jgi:hypothetical protein
MFEVQKYSGSDTKYYQLNDTKAHIEPYDAKLLAAL